MATSKEDFKVYVDVRSDIKGRFTEGQKQAFTKIKEDIDTMLKTLDADVPIMDTIHVSFTSHQAVSHHPKASAEKTALSIGVGVPSKEADGNKAVEAPAALKSTIVPEGLHAAHAAAA